MSRTRIFIFALLLLVAGASLRPLYGGVIQPAELQRMMSIISFLKSKLAGEETYDNASPKVKLESLISSLELFGLTVANKENLSPDLSQTDLAIAILGATPPKRRQVVIADLTVFLRQFPAQFKEQPVTPTMPRGSAIRSLGRAQQVEPRTVSKPNEVQKYFHGKRRALHDLLERETKKQAAISRAEEKRRAGKTNLQEVMAKIKAHREELFQKAEEEPQAIEELEPEVIEEPEPQVEVEETKRKESMKQMLAKIRQHRENLVQDFYHEEEAETEESEETDVEYTEPEVAEEVEPEASEEPEPQVEEEDTKSTIDSAAEQAKRKESMKERLAKIRQHREGLVQDLYYEKETEEPVDQNQTAKVTSMLSDLKPEKPVLPKTPYKDNKGKEWLVGPKGHESSETKIELPPAHK